MILLTIGYPYPNKDSFISNEIGILAKKFNNIWILPVFEGVILPKRQCIGDPNPLPPNVHICKLGYQLSDVLRFDPLIIKEMLANWSFRYSKLQRLIRWSLHGNIVQRNIMRIVKEKGIDPNATILYSFWFHHGAFALACMRERFALKVSRAHGYDLYEERGYQPFKKFILKKIDAVFACSKMGMDYLKKVYQSDKIFVSYLGTVNNMPANRYPERGDVFHIVSCSRLVDLKRVHRIADALALIDDHKIKWTHIGDGILFEKLKAYADEKLGEKRNIEFIFTGALSNDAVLNFYSRNTVNAFINVSATEGLPVSIMEISAFGVPTIATDVGGTREAVRNGENGFLLNEDFKDEDLMSKIISLISMPDDIYHIHCKAARNLWDDTFDAYKNYDSFAEKLIEMARSHTRNSERQIFDSPVQS